MWRARLTATDQKIWNVLARGDASQTANQQCAGNKIDNMSPTSCWTLQVWDNLKEKE